MKTFYDILKVKQNATQEEILNSYYKLEKKYSNNNEILKKLQIAKEVLTNSDARNNYDKKLEEIKQNELISNINNNTINYNIKKCEDEKRIEEKSKQMEIKNKKNILKQKEQEELKRQKEQRKEEKKYEKLENKINKEQEKKTKELYEEAYADYLESLGFKVERKWTVKRIKRLIILSIALIVICFILWNIPTVREKLIDLYNNNFIIKMLIDLIISIINSIINWIKRFIESR